MVRNGTMRKDLYYRLAVFLLELPPLRERMGDIPLLAKHFLHGFARENVKDIKGFTPNALEKLASAYWEGNVRELKHAIERAVLLSNSKTIDEDDLELTSKTVSLSRPNDDAVNTDKRPQVSNPDITISLLLADASLSRVEKELVREVLKQMRGNKKRAAGILKISRPRLDRLINDDPEFFKSVTG
jgi:DNA-binding NtrC family response regulator